jgi:hypothetical protein
VTRFNQSPRLEPRVISGSYLPYCLLGSSCSVWRTKAESSQCLHEFVTLA